MKRRAPNCAVVQRLDEAVALAARVAGIAAPDSPPKEELNGHANTNLNRERLPTVVLLSPGGTSYDAYRDFEERGEHFRRLIDRWQHTASTQETELAALARESAAH